MLARYERGARFDQALCFVRRDEPFGLIDVLSAEKKRPLFC